MKKLIYFTLLLYIASFSYAATSSTPQKAQQKKKHHHHKKHVQKHSHKHKHAHAVATTTTTDQLQALTNNDTTNVAPKTDASGTQNSQDNSITNSNNFNPAEKDGNIINQPRFYSYSTLSVNADSGEIYTSKNSTIRLPIASISKLMMAMVTLDSDSDMNDYVTISQNDVDSLRHTYSRLRVGAKYKRKDLLLLALMSSENRAAHALARTSYSGGLKMFIAKMNAKAKSLGMTDTRFYDPTGLNEMNQSTALDLSKMVHAAFEYKLIRQDTTTKGSDFVLEGRYIHHSINSDALVRAGKLDIELSKTGFINEAGHCLVLYVMVNKTPVIMVFLNSSGKNGRILDAITTKNYIRRLI